MKSISNIVKYSEILSNNINYNINVVNNSKNNENYNFGQITKYLHLCQSLLIS